MMNRTRHIWTEDEMQQLREAYAREDTFISVLAEQLDIPLQSVYQKARRMGLLRPKTIAAIAGAIGAQDERSISHRFAPGCVPANKGKKMRPEVYAKVSRTMFKKGQSPINHRDVGSERVNVDGYVEVKVAEPNKWRLKHRIVWEREHGEIQKGYNIQFRDGNKQNCSIDNLYIISRSEQMRTQNSMYARYPQELICAIRARGTLKRQITMYNKRNNE